jgi:hypothetical protein
MVPWCAAAAGTDASHRKAAGRMREVEKMGNASMTARCGSHQRFDVWST